MEVKRIKLISLIWAVTSLTAISRSQNIPNITNLFCLNDYQKKMFCSWETVGSSSNCSEDFTLTYKDLQGTDKRCQDLQNEQIGGSTVPNKCICRITVDFFFVVGETYKIEVESHDRLVDSTIIDIASTVQPRPPYNVRIDFQEEVNGVVQWDIGYEFNFIQSKLSFHVQILAKHSREVAKQDFLTRLEPRYTFSKRQLKQGEEYVVRVRMKPAEQLGFKGNWSEWSSEAEWRNDYSLTVHDLRNILIPITCISMLCLIIVNYVCFIRYKKWLNNIPNPAKSKLLQSKLLQKEPLNPDGKSAAKTSCESFFTRIVKAHKSRCDKLTQQHNAEVYVNNICESYYTKKVFFEPEDEDIERCVKMYLKMENENPVEENKKEHKAEDHLLGPGDLSIAKMFLDILCDTSGRKVDTFENFNAGTSFGCSGWMDRVGKKETERCNSDISTYRETGYNSYGFDDSPLDMDRLNTSYFEQWSDNERDGIQYTPPVSIRERCLNQKKWDHLESSGYNHFTSAVYDERKYLINDQPKTICLDGVSNRVICNNNSHKRLLTPKSVLYYNTKNIFSHNENNFQSIIIPKSEQITGNTFNSYESKNNPTSMCHVSGYQCFEQAVQENDAEIGCLTSGYKSFDQAVLEGGPDSRCQVSGYQSFDQAVQEGDVTSVYQVTGYQSFDQAVQQNETSGSTNCSVGYRPLEDLIKDGFENDGQYQLEESHCQNKTESPQTEKFTDIKDNSNNKFVNSKNHELPSSGLTQIWLEDFANLTKDKFNSSDIFSDKSLKALKIAVDTYLDNDFAKTHKKAPFALTFDICEHLRNLENMNFHKGPFNSLILPCHVDEIWFIQEQLTLNRYLIGQKCPSTKFDTFENLSYFVPLCGLEALDSSQPLLIQQINADTEGNSYMKLALT